MTTQDQAPGTFKTAKMTITWGADQDRDTGYFIDGEPVSREHFEAVAGADFLGDVTQDVDDCGND